MDYSCLNAYTVDDEISVDKALSQELKNFKRKIVVLDDDPTGVQTVHDISVFTDWKRDTVEKGFLEENSLFFILTNSRSFLPEYTIKVHREIAKNIVAASKASGKDFIVISRSDSTLRGNYPIETQVLKDEIEQLTRKRFNGEIIFPFFKGGERFTIDNIHYVKSGDKLLPVGMTEFARDKTFGYQSSHLGDWCEEKTHGAFKASDMIYISLEDLRSRNFDHIEEQLTSCRGFNKIIVNSIDYIDVKVFMTAFIRAVNKGMEFIFRSAADAVKVIGGITDKPLLVKKDLIKEGDVNGGVIIVGSHVNRTTQQLAELKNCHNKVKFIEFNQHLVLRDGGLEGEVKRVVPLIENEIRLGNIAVVYTRRDRLDMDSSRADEQLTVSVKISESVASIVAKLSVRPGFIIAKGGITSSDIGIKALGVRRADVMGQIKPGIPVWRTGAESKFPNMPFIIFPGNVGGESTLKDVVDLLG